MQLENKAFQNLIMIPKKKAIFLDRDGVLNKNRDDYVKTIHELEIYPHIGQNIKKINEKGFLVIVITNQSAIGRKITSKNEVEKIHLYLQDYLKKHNAKIDAFYYCPHTPSDNCNCRKPKPGLIIQAANDFGIDLKQSWMIGDHDRDVQSGLNAGCKSIKITSENTLDEIVNTILKS